MGHAEEIIIDIVKELKPNPTILTLLYQSNGKPFFCRWNFQANKKQDYSTDNNIFESPAEGTLMVQGLDPNSPSLHWDDGNYVKPIERKGFFLKKKDTEFNFSHQYHSYAEKALLHHVVLPEYYYIKSGSINKEQASIWKADTRVCVTWLNDIRKTGEREYTLDFKFAGPDKEKFEGMKEQRPGEVKGGIKSINISEDKKQAMLTITALITSVLDAGMKFTGR